MSEMQKFIKEVKAKAAAMDPPSEVKIQKLRTPKFKVPKIRLKKAADRVLPAAPKKRKAQWENIFDDIKKRKMQKTAEKCDESDEIRNRKKQETGLKCDES